MGVGMSENPIAEFQKDLHKLAVTVARMEEKIDRVLTVTDIVNTHTGQIATIETELKGTHRRLDEMDRLIDEVDRRLTERINTVNPKIDRAKKEIYWTAGVIVAAINFAFWFLEKVGNK